MNFTACRKLTEAEIAVLEGNGCSSSDWGAIRVAESFTPQSLKNTTFSGAITLGKNVTIRNVERLESTGGSTFGGGVKVAVLNESGGREVPIYKGLTAQIACLSAMYRHRPEAVRAIERLVDAEAAANTPKSMLIGNGSTIAHCGALTDVCIGENAVLEGVAELTNGTVDSTEDSPTRIGRGVILRDFIVADGAQVTDYAVAEKCFIGQGCRIDKGFTATNSLFFANCECEQGEACAIFAGPYTVTHHKSTLLIGGMFSFYNAGSGTNMNNHMYRLGPIHQGVFERGCKTGGSSHILFPIRAGAFSMIKGHHENHPDTTNLPFSYLIENNGKTRVLPGLLLKSIGLARDERKWPARDRRKGIKRDHIAFDTLNPYTVEQIFKGLASGKAGRGGEIYRTVADAYFGDVVLKRLKSGKPLENGAVPHKEWTDLAGLIAPAAEVERILKMLPAMHSIHELSLALTGLYEHYDEWEWDYAVARMGSDDWKAVLEKGIEASEKVLEWRLSDAVKEYAAPMRISYGTGGGEAERDAEFEAIHGTPLSNPFLDTLRREFEEKKALAETLLKKIDR